MELSIWGILAAAAAHALLGYAWYHPRAFGPHWMRHINMSPECAERAAKRARLNTTLAIIAGLVLASVLAYLHEALTIRSFQDGLLLAGLVWLGFVMPAMLGSVVWEQRPVALYFIDAGYWLLSLAVMSFILAF